MSKFEISALDRATIESLVDPTDVQQNTYQHDFRISQKILGILISDRHFLVQSMDLIKPEYFEDDGHSLICSVTFDFFKQYDTMPSKAFIENEILERRKNSEHLYQYLGELEAILTDYIPGMDSREYLMDKIVEFGKEQAARCAVSRTMDVLKRKPKGAWNKIWELWREALTTDKGHDIGLDYFNTLEERYQRMEDQVNRRDEIFSSGFPDHGLATGRRGIDSLLTAGGLCRGELGAFVGLSGAGKCFQAGTQILMFDGTVKAVEDVKVGDLVMGDDSTPRTILSLHSGRDMMYAVTPTKGERYVVNSQHVLVLKPCGTYIKKSGKRYEKYTQSGWKSGDLVEMPVCEFLKQTKGFKGSLKGLRTSVAFPGKAVRIDPYFLGVWLGDGTDRTTDVTTADDEIVDLKHYNLIQNKHVPFDYKVNSREVRLQILAGLLDTDGSLSQSCCYDFINKNKVISHDVAFIARSLGLAAYISESRKKSQNGTEGIYWRVSISGDCDEIPVRVVRKKAKPRGQIKNHRVTGIKVTPVGEDFYYGFETDGNHRFVLGDFTVVHNSIALIGAAAQNLVWGKKVCYITLEMSEDKIAKRFDAWLSEEPFRSLVDHKKMVFEAIRSHVRHDEDHRRLVVKHYPGGTADINTFRAYLSQLNLYGFKPDLLVVDYIGELKDLPNMKVYESRQLLVRDMRTLAQEEKICVLTAAQANRKGREIQEYEGSIDDDSLADAFGISRPMDGMWSINKNENASNLGWIYVMKHRDGISKRQIWFEMNTETLKMNEVTYAYYKERIAAFRAKKGNEVNVPQMEIQ